MKTFLTCALLSFFIPFLIFGVPMQLDNLDEYDEETCVKILHETDTTVLWDYFLKGQIHLFFPSEIAWLEGEALWTSAQYILELGSGNGYFLHMLSEVYENKSFQGIEIDAPNVEQANREFGNAKVKYTLGDVEREIPEYINQFDVVIFRLTLQHLQQPKQALQHAYHYVKPGGLIVIIDSCDKARRSSHKNASVEEVLSQLNSKNETLLKKDRYITLKILKDLINQDSTLPPFKILNSNVDSDGNPLEIKICHDNKTMGKYLFRHTMLFLKMIQMKCGIAVDFPQAYRDSQMYLTETEGWHSPGVHWLMLKKD